MQQDNKKSRAGWIIGLVIGGSIFSFIILPTLFILLIGAILPDDKNQQASAPASEHQSIAKAEPTAQPTPAPTPEPTLTPKQIAAKKKQEAEEQAAFVKLMAQQRKNMAKDIEQALLDDGVDSRVTTTGKDGTTLKISGFGVGRVFANKFMKADGIHDSLLKHGFKRVEFHPKYGDEYTYYDL
ncbi:hypothetical protein [Chitinilyticum aquatile]|uniref:hypothetical protein n=1 Tax=Chitinilyticum aquatile TaxID=362520 RepID=UPI00041E3AF5|nr:hypothetical protein [Chitinilyticum aquatile]